MGLGFWLAEAERDYASDQEDRQTVYSYLRMMNEKNQEVAQLKSEERGVLQQFAREIVSDVSTN